ncbi:hypothetical protein D6C78_06244 [Aureobasidium pullulans]|uniref:Uncharacterized protein n=1 Tax=Aureobasidium pullulans TaxID=5580 RepID=A0A4T0BL92_AURPU|nr:hypothetical protein D6C78_06244 [Aureobasidium pullulans]
MSNSQINSNMTWHIELDTAIYLYRAEMFEECIVDIGTVFRDNTPLYLRLRYYMLFLACCLDDWYEAEDMRFHAETTYTSWCPSDFTSSFLEAEEEDDTTTSEEEEEENAAAVDGRGDTGTEKEEGIFTADAEKMKGIVAVVQAEEDTTATITDGEVATFTLGPEQEKDDGSARAGAESRKKVASGSGRHGQGV